jgi:hypothetical protein
VVLNFVSPAFRDFMAFVIAHPFEAYQGGLVWLEPSPYAAENLNTRPAPDSDGNDAVKKSPTLLSRVGRPAGSKEQEAEPEQKRERKSVRLWVTVTSERENEMSYLREYQIR